MSIPFESSVIPYGDQTFSVRGTLLYWFESSVIPYGDQTIAFGQRLRRLFESSVIPYGDQTTQAPAMCQYRLRVV